MNQSMVQGSMDRLVRGSFGPSLSVIFSFFGTSSVGDYSIMTALRTTIKSQTASLYTRYDCTDLVPDGGCDKCKAVQDIPQNAPKLL